MTAAKNTIDPDARQRAREALEACCEYTAAVGAGLANVLPGVIDSLTDAERGHFEKLASNVLENSMLAAALSVVIGSETKRRIESN
jgi:hypothetical protein